MKPISLGWPGRGAGRPGSRLNTASTSSQASTSSKPGLGRAALTCGTLSTCGDIIAQMLTRRYNRSRGLPVSGFDAARTLRMTSFGLLVYGPAQHYWYAALDRQFPQKAALQDFLAKVMLNQLALGPVVLASVFAWNLLLTGHPKAIPGKIRRDLPPTIVNGWKFWIPVSAANFRVIPLQQQVLFMSTAGLIWQTYLSYTSNS